MKPPKPVEVEPEYPERRAPLLKRDTSDISLGDVAHELKRQALRRVRTWVAVGGVGALGLGGTGTGLFRSSRRNEVLELRLQAMEERVTRVRLQLATCGCPDREP